MKAQKHITGIITPLFVSSTSTGRAIATDGHSDTNRATYKQNECLHNRDRDVAIPEFRANAVHRRRTLKTEARDHRTRNKAVSRRNTSFGRR